MHAHERTYLAKLGFSDPDLRLPLHDLACQYLTTESVLNRLAQFMGMKNSPQPRNCTFKTNDGEFERESLVTQQVGRYLARMEFEISKGYDQFRTTIGFVDVHAQIAFNEHHTNARQRQLHARGMDFSPEWKNIPDYTNECHGLDLYIEVKVTPVTISEIVRQINVYKSYSRSGSWIVATTYELSGAEIKCLADENLRHIFLGKQFQAYVNERQSAEPVDNIEI